MFWFTALNEPFPEFKERNNQYREMLKVALLSARRNAPGLKPVHIYNGREEAFHDELRALGAEVVFHRLSFENDLLRQAARPSYWKDIARGAFLRLDIPLIFPALRECIYTDVDIVFIDDPTKYKLTTRTVALAPEFDLVNFKDINSGSMLFNCAGVKNIFTDIRKYSIEHLQYIPDYDQGAIKAFLNGEWDRLSPLMNWKPYWGINDSAIVLHFHGPKPHDFLNYELRSPAAPVYEFLFRRAPESYKHALDTYRSFVT
jgi:lipopolysaccharide biosynthesis glycosyltransferase